MKILITGSKGFIGQQLQRKYEGHQVLALDIEGEHGYDAREFFRKDDYKFDLAFNCAAVIGGRRGIEGQPLAVAVDLSIDAEYFNWIERTQPTHAVYFSSSAAYPTLLQEGKFQIKLHEDHLSLKDIALPDFSYGWSKLTGEYLAQFVTKTKMHIFRPFSGYGETQALDYPFPSFIQRGKQKADPFEVWGDGNQVRDFIHVDDIIDAMDEAIKQDVQGPINLGNARATSFNELAEMVMQQAGYRAPIEHLTAEPTGVSYRVCDNTKLLSFYTPKISLEEGIQRALDYT
jgi:nucleoside-diphosphate-sugar epimerase